MTNTGIVKSVKNNYVIVETKRTSACGDSCAGCGMCNVKPHLVQALNKANAKEGDIVKLYMKDRSVLSAAFLFYIIPLLLLISGFLLPIGRETVSILLGLGFMCVYFVILHVFNKLIITKFAVLAVEVLQNTL